MSLLMYIQNFNNLQNCFTFNLPFDKESKIRFEKLQVHQFMLCFVMFVLNFRFVLLLFLVSVLYIFLIHTLVMKAGLLSFISFA